MKMLIGVLPSLGGYVYAAKTSPLDPGKISLNFVFKLYLVIESC